MRRAVDPHSFFADEPFFCVEYGRGGGVVELPTRVPYMLPCGLRNIPSTQNTDTETTVLN